MRSAVGLFDQSSFAKFRLEGADAERVLNRVCANDVDVAPGKIIYTQWLNERGGIEADLTVTRLSESAYLIVSGAETESKDFNWLQRHIEPGAHCVLTNVTSGMGVLSVMGPRARELLQSLTPNDLSDAAFPFATSQVIELGFALVRASRITYVGELGWELYVPTEFMQGVYDELVSAGAALRARSCRLSRARIRCASKRPTGTGATTSPTRTRRSKPASASRSNGTKPADSSAARRCCGNGNPDAASAWCNSSSSHPEPLLYHNEPIWQGDAIVGFIRSGMYGHSLGAAVGLGYVTAANGAAVGRHRRR